MDMDVDASRVSARKAFIDGAVCNLLNPKVIILFLALLPNFVDKSKDDTLGQLLFLALILVVINVLWQVPIAWATETIRKWMARPGVQKAVNTVTGCFLVFFAALMLWEHLILS